MVWVLRDVMERGKYLLFNWERETKYLNMYSLITNHFLKIYYHCEKLTLDWTEVGPANPLPISILFKRHVENSIIDIQVELDCTVTLICKHVCPEPLLPLPAAPLLLSVWSGWVILLYCAVDMTGTLQWIRIDQEMYASIQSIADKGKWHCWFNVEC